MTAIKCKNLEYDYKFYNQEGTVETFKALKGIDIDIEDGSFVAILGHNGSGKSTLAKTINNILVPSSGELEVYGLDGMNPKNTWDIRSNVGMVFQNPDNQIVSSIVEDDVAFGLENMGVPSEEIRKNVDMALEWTGLTKYKELSPNQLSGGQKQRVAIAGILAMHPKCIILDEPTAMLDPIGRKEIIATVQKLNKEEGITILLITHFMEEAILADKVYVMENGHIVMEDIPRKIFTQVDELKNLGLDVPEVTEISYNLRKKGLDLPSDILTIDEMVGAICRLK